MSTVRNNIMNRCRPNLKDERLHKWVTSEDPAVGIGSTSASRRLICSLPSHYLWMAIFVPGTNPCRTVE
jgi:hypothetical protein